MSASTLNPDDFEFGDPNKLRAYIAERMAAVAMRVKRHWNGTPDRLPIGTPS